MKRAVSPYHHTRALVLGASGFIGYWVARALRAQRSHVTCVVRDAVSAERLVEEQLGSVVVRRNLTELDAIGDWLPALRPAVVFNLAGYGVDRGEEDDEVATCINHLLVRKVAEVVATLPPDHWPGARLVHVGSALEYGRAGGTLAEDTTCQPTNLYGRTKLAGTRALQDVVLETGVDACVVRLFTVFGPGEHRGRLLPSLLEATQHDAAVPLSEGLQRRDFAYVEDVAEGLLRLAVSEVSAGEVVNLASGVMHTVREFVETAAEVIGLEAHRLQFGALPPRPDEMAHDGVSVARLRALTRWTPSDDVAEGVGRTVARRTEAALRTPGTGP